VFDLGQEKIVLDRVFSYGIVFSEGRINPPLQKDTMSRLVNVHVEYAENSDHTLYTIEVPEKTSRNLCRLIAKGLLFESSWVLDDSNGHNWSIWVDEECVEAHGKHEKFKDLAEPDVEWIYGNVGW
jgi:hypothetical protein